MTTERSFTQRTSWGITLKRLSKRFHKELSETKASLEAELREEMSGIRSNTNYLLNRTDKLNKDLDHKTIFLRSHLDKAVAKSKEDLTALASRLDTRDEQKDLISSGQKDDHKDFKSTLDTHIVRENSH